MWGVALAIDLGTPWLAVRHSVKAPPDAAHLPERFGLFTLILLGESVVAVMHGIESQEDWTPAAASSAFLGMGISFLIWWWYFDGASGASPQPVRTRREAIRFHIWTYAHFPLALGIIVAGVGIHRSVTAASRAVVGPTDVLMLSGAVTLVSASGVRAANRFAASSPLLSAAFLDRALPSWADCRLWRSGGAASTSAWKFVGRIAAGTLSASVVTASR